MSDAITNRKLEQKAGADGGGGTSLEQPIPFECIGICVSSPGHEREVRGSPVYLLIVKYLSIWLKFSHGILDWSTLSWNFLGIFF